MSHGASQLSPAGVSSQGGQSTNAQIGDRISLKGIPAQSGPRPRRGARGPACPTGVRCRCWSQTQAVTSWAQSEWTASGHFSTHCFMRHCRMQRERGHESCSCGLGARGIGFLRPYACKCPPVPPLRYQRMNFHPSGSRKPGLSLEPLAYPSTPGPAGKATGTRRGSQAAGTDAAQGPVRLSKPGPARDA